MRPVRRFCRSRKLMALYDLGATYSTGASNLPSNSVKAGASSNIRIYEVAATSNAAVACAFGFGRPANDGSVVQTSTTNFQPESIADPAAGAKFATTWSTAPTSPAVFLRRGAWPATVNYGFIWTFPRGLVLFVNKDVCTWNIVTAAAAMQVSIVINE